MPKQPPIVVLDPGHGGSTKVGGSSPNNVSGPNGLLEKDVALDVGRRVGVLLGDRATVVLTRNGDENRSLVDRARVARDTDADVFLSIHFNGGRSPDVNGSEAWIATSSNEGSHALARAVLDRVVAVTRARDRGVREADLGVLLPARQGADTAATLVELAFLTNPAEAERLTNDVYRQALAQAIADGVTDRLRARGAAVQALAVVPEPERVDGVHPSEHNANNPSAADLIADGLLFAIHRASHGNVVDPYYAGPTDRRYDDARANHMIVGAYHYAQAHDPGGLAYFRSQAETLVRVVKRLLPGDLPPTFDFEEQDCAADVTWEGTQWLEPMTAFLDGVETALGRVPMIYTQQSVWHDHIETVANPANKDDAAFAYFADYPLWVIDILDAKPNRFANRGGSPRRLPKPWADAPWDNWAIWQYSDNFTPTEFTNLHGTEAQSDMDVSNGGIHVLRGLADLGRPAPYGSGDRFVAHAHETGEIFVRSLQGGAWVGESLNRYAGEADLTACIEAGKQYLAYKDRDDGHLYELERGAASGPVALTTGSTRPVGHFEYVVDLPHRYIAYWGEDDRVYLLVCRDGAWQAPIDVTSAVGLADASGSPLAYVSGATVHVVARTSDNARKGHLWDVWQDGGQWQKRDLTSDAGAPPATYRPATSTDAAGTSVIFRAAPEPGPGGTTLRGQIHRITPGLHDENLSAAASAPTCAGSPAVFALSGSLHVVYRSASGDLHELVQDGDAWHARDLGCSQRAAADPAIFVDPFGGPRVPVVYAVYRGRDGDLHEATLDADTWTCSA